MPGKRTKPKNFSVKDVVCLKCGKSLIWKMKGELVIVSPCVTCPESMSVFETRTSRKIKEDGDKSCPYCGVRGCDQRCLGGGG